MIELDSLTSPIKTVGKFYQRQSVIHLFFTRAHHTFLFLPFICGLLVFQIAGLCTLRAHAQFQAHAKHQQTFLDRIENEHFTHISITKNGNKTVATDPATGNTLRSDTDPRDVIGWALNMADAVVVRKGRYELSSTLEIPRPNVTLIIGKKAELASAPDAKLTKISIGHGAYETLIRVKNRDHVRIINLGTIESYNIGVIFDGRNAGNVGINGGGIFSTGTLKCNEGIWIVDSANISVPVVWGDHHLNNAPLVLEGTEDCELGFIAGLMGKENRENETLDLNSYNRRTQIDTVLGWVPGGTSDEILDINGSPKTKVNRVLGFGASEGTKLVNIFAYPLPGRRLTQKKFIGHSKGTTVNSEEIITKPVRTWKTRVKPQGFPDRLPNITIMASITAVFEDGTKRQVLNKRFQLDLATSSDK